MYEDRPKIESLRAELGTLLLTCSTEFKENHHAVLTSIQNNIDDLVKPLVARATEQFIGVMQSPLGSVLRFLDPDAAKPPLLVTLRSNLNTAKTAVQDAKARGWINMLGEGLRSGFDEAMAARASFVTLLHNSLPWLHDALSDASTPNMEDPTVLEFIASLACPEVTNHLGELKEWTPFKTKCYELVSKKLQERIEVGMKTYCTFAQGMATLYTNTPGALNDL